jgi:hypothetical protein
MKRALTQWLSVATDCWLLGAEAAVVVPLRLARLAGGGAAAKAEAQLMVSEKIVAADSLLRELGHGRLGKGAADLSAGIVRHYLMRVRANRKRLLGGA